MWGQKEDIVTMVWRSVTKLVTTARHEGKGGAGGTKAHIWRLEGTSPRPAEYLRLNDRGEDEREREGGGEERAKEEDETLQSGNGSWRRRLR